MTTNLLRPLRLRDFRLLFGGESISVLGDYSISWRSPGCCNGHVPGAGAIVAGTALIGFASGVAGRMTYEPIEVPTIGGSEPAR